MTKRKRMSIITESFIAQDVYRVEASSKAEAEAKFLRAAGDEDRGQSKGIHQVDHGISGVADVKTYTARAWDKLWSSLTA